MGNTFIKIVGYADDTPYFWQIGLATKTLIQTKKEHGNIKRTLCKTEINGTIIEQLPIPRSPNYKLRQSKR